MQTDSAGATALKTGGDLIGEKRIAAKFGKLREKLKAVFASAVQIWFSGKLYPVFLQAPGTLESIRRGVLVKFLLKVLRLKHIKIKAGRKSRASRPTELLALIGVRAFYAHGGLNT